MMQHYVRRAPQPDRHHQCIGDQLCGHRRTHGPPNHSSRDEADNLGDIEPAFGGPEVGTVRDPFGVRRCGVELLVEHIRRDDIRRAHPGVQWHPSPSRVCAQGGEPHQPLNSMEATGYSLHEHVVPAPSSAVGTIAGEEAGPHSVQQLRVGPRPDTRRPGPPGIDACARDTECLTQPSRAANSPVLREVGRGFFKMSRSAFSLMTSRRSRASSACLGFVCPGLEKPAAN